MERTPAEQPSPAETPKRRYKRQNEAPLCPVCGKGRLWSWSSQEKAYLRCTLPGRKPGCGYKENRGRETEEPVVGAIKNP